MQHYPKFDLRPPARARKEPSLPRKMGPFKLRSTLGRGTYGVVKRGVDRATKTDVAVKIIIKQYIGEQPNFYTDIEREVEILKTLDHPHIIKYHGVCETKRHIGIVLDYIGGGELTDLINTCGPLPEIHARELFGQLVSSVQYMHRRNIVHRDLKLENILLVDRYTLKVVDFGLAKDFCPGNDWMKSKRGTPFYSPPEQLLTGDDPVYSGMAADIWACGVILYALTCGDLPFRDNGEDLTGIYRSIQATALSFPEFVSQEVQDLISQMVVIDPARRCSIEAVVQHPWLAPCNRLFLSPVTADDSQVRQKQEPPAAAEEPRPRAPPQLPPPALGQPAVNRSCHPQSNTRNPYRRPWLHSAVQARTHQVQTGYYSHPPMARPPFPNPDRMSHVNPVIQPQPERGQQPKPKTKLVGWVKGMIHRIPRVR